MVHYNEKNEFCVKNAFLFNWFKLVLTGKLCVTWNMFNRRTLNNEQKYLKDLKNFQPEPVHFMKVYRSKWPECCISGCV